MVPAVTDATGVIQAAASSGLGPHWTAMQPGEAPRPQHQSVIRYRPCPMTRLPNDPDHTQHELRCRQLARLLDQTWRNIANDEPLAVLLLETYRSLDEQDKPSKKHMIEVLRAFLQLTIWNMDARGAFAWLTTSKWDLERAVRAYMNQRFQLDGGPECERENEGVYGEEEPTAAGRDDQSSPAEDKIEPSEEEQRELYVDEDPENLGNIPEGFHVEIYRDPDTGNEVQAVRHEHIRHFLIEQAAKQGQYKYGRKIWPEDDEETDDQTSFLRPQRLWGVGLSQRQHFPPIIFVFERKDRRDPSYVVPHMRWRGLLVIDFQGQPVRRFRNIPATLSTQLEGGLMEAICREDSRVNNHDFLARMPREWQEQKLDGTWTTHPMVVNTLASRIMRFRELAACVNWTGRVQAMKPYDRFLRDNLPQVLQDANSTRGLARNFNERERDLIKHSNKLDHVPVNFQLAEEFPKGPGGKARSFYHPDSGHDCRDCMPQGLEDLAALNDALLITVAHFIHSVGKCPRLPLGKMTYNQFLAVIEEQYQGERTGRRQVQHRLLPQIGCWTGGIGRWRSGVLLNR